MQKVITINLNGNAVQLEEAGYEALRAYLAHAEAHLGSNPDTSEILRDLEQSIAEKCQHLLGPGKGVVTAAEVEQILREVGPVENGGDAQHDPSMPQPRRLYQIREGGMVSGVANGLAAYLNIDPSIVRVAWVMAAVMELTNYDRPPALTLGAYALLMFLVPYAKTSAQRAAAQGAAKSLPYRLQGAVERVKGLFAGRLHHRAH